MKTFVLTVSRTFPEKHPKAGQETYFPQRITGEFPYELPHSLRKIHTIRANFPLWEKRMKQVQEGEAVVSLRYWSGKPRKNGSKQIEFARIDKDSGCGVQELVLNPKCILSDSVELFSIDSNFYNPLNLGLLSKNDGLSLDDFKAWFKGYDLTKPMAIIHFTSFRY